MATGFKLADGRDLSDIFTAGDAGLTVGYQTPNGVDLGRQFIGGSTGVVTGYRDYSGIDLGSRFGNDPWIAQGYTLNATASAAKITELTPDRKDRSKPR